MVLVSAVPLDEVSEPSFFFTCIVGEIKTLLNIACEKSEEPLNLWIQSSRKTRMEQMRQLCRIQIWQPLGKFFSDLSSNAYSRGKDWRWKNERTVKALWHQKLGTLSLMRVQRCFEDIGTSLLATLSIRILSASAVEHIPCRMSDFESKRRTINLPAQKTCNHVDSVGVPVQNGMINWPRLLQAFIFSVMCT